MERLFAFTTAAQVANGIAAAVIAPAIAGITLGLVRQRGYAPGPAARPEDDDVPLGCRHRPALR